MEQYRWLKVAVSLAAFVTLGWLLTPVISAAGETKLLLASLVEELTLQNPEIKAARQRWEAAKAIVPQVQTLPDPTVKLGYQRMPMREPLQGIMYGIGQEIPFPGKLRLKGEVAQREADRIEQDYLVIRLRLIARLKETYFDLHYVHKAIEIVERNKALLMQFEKRPSLDTPSARPRSKTSSARRSRSRGCWIGWRCSISRRRVCMPRSIGS